MQTLIVAFKCHATHRKDFFGYFRKANCWMMKVYTQTLPFK